MAEVQRKGIKFITDGMALSQDSDLMQETKFYFLQNCRISVDGRIKARNKLGIHAELHPATPDVIHSIKNLIDRSSNSKLKVIGAGTKLYAGNSDPIEEVDNGYSGDVLTLIDFRPEQSIEPFIYVYDGNKLCKVKSDGTKYNQGIKAPKNPPTIKFAQPIRKIIDNCDVDTGWATSTAGITVASRISTTTLSDAFSDEVAPSFASITLTDFPPELGEGTSLIIEDHVREIIVEEILPSTLNIGTTTVGAISYDVGSSGPCTIVFSSTISDLAQNIILKLNASEYVKVNEVIKDKNGRVSSIRTSTIGTIAVGDSIESIPTFRTFIDSDIDAGKDVVSDALEITIGSAISTLTKDGATDLTTTYPETEVKALTEDDVFHISIFMSNTSELVSGQIQLNVNPDFVDFEHDWFFFEFNANDLEASIGQSTSLISLIQRNVQRSRYRRVAQLDPTGEILDLPDPVQINTLDQAGLGKEVYTEFRIPLKSFIRGGKDFSKTLKDVNSIRISFNTTSPDPITVRIDSIWVGEGDKSEESRSSPSINPFNYVYRYRDTRTGVTSNWSPPFREGRFDIPKRALLVAEPSDDPQTNFIEFARFGGALNDTRVLGGKSNDDNPFEDSFPDANIADNEKVYFDDYQVFALLQKPMKGVCDVNGFILTIIDGDDFGTDFDNFTNGIQLLVDGKPNTFYKRPNSQFEVELNKDMGILSEVEFSIPEPLKVAQPLPIVSGVYGYGNFGLFVFAAGDPNAPSTIYYTDGNSPDNMSDKNRFELCSPSEPIQAIVIYDAVPFAWTDEASYIIRASINERGLTFAGFYNANSEGLFCRTGICVGNKFIYYQTKGGISRVQGNGNPQSITEQTFRNFFPKDGIGPTSIILISGEIEIDPPDFILLNDIRLSCDNQYLYYRFTDINGKHRQLVYDEFREGWISYDTFKNDKMGVFYSEEDEGNFDLFVGLDGKLAKFNNTSEFENGLECKILTPSLNYGDSRLYKEFKEAFLRFKNGTSGFTSTLYFDNYKTINPDAPKTVAGDSLDSIQELVIDINEGEGVQAKSIGLYLNWLIESRCEFLEFEPSFIPKPEDVYRRFTDLDDSGYIGDKLYKGVYIEVNTYDEDKIIKIIDDEGIDRGNLTLKHNGQRTKFYQVTEFIANKTKFAPQDDFKFQNFSAVWIFEKLPELSSIATEWTDLGSIDLKYIEGFDLEVDTDGQDVLFDLQGDNEEVLQANFKVNSQNRTVIPFSLTEPKLSHLVRLVPKSNWRYYSAKFFFDKEPEIAIYWKPQPTTHGFIDPHFIEKLMIGISSTSKSTLSITIDGIKTDYEIPSTGGIKQQLYIQVKAKKGLVYQYELVSESGARIYQKDFVVWVQSFNSNQQAVAVHPFGDVDAEVGAQI